ncbi:related to Zinc finger protein REH1 [Saccharomycodes ludwigii]|uniref:Related to Zinc finger protein REH1 n=1 Tax=Saccharomycodes ludwigii TaxID=36035 RepID=A0A376B169_9ASCO|nr:related to Zinc finger protein REH1 [Saccharomycodes ludwigii]
MNSITTVPTTTLFTCNSCMIQFVSSDLQRFHMKTEWHRYNLKRRVAGLPSVSANEFSEKLKVSEKQHSLNQVDEFGFAVLKPIKDKRKKKPAKNTEVLNTVEFLDDLSPQKLSEFSDSELSSGFDEETASELGYTSESAFELTDEDPSDFSSSSDDEYSTSSNDDYESAYSLTDCIFCGVHNKEIELNVRHMFQNHGLYIPERSFLVDLKGLLEFLIDIVVAEKHCLCCNFQGSTLESIRAHMDSKRHCKMPYETLREKALFEDYYDYSPLNSDNNHNSNFLKQSKNNVQFKIEERGEENEIQKISEVAFKSNTEGSSNEEDKQNNYKMKLLEKKKARREKALAAVSTFDRRLAGGLTKKEYEKVQSKMQQLEKKAINKAIQLQIKRCNNFANFRDETM